MFACAYTPLPLRLYPRASKVRRLYPRASMVRRLYPFAFTKGDRRRTCTPVTPVTPLPLYPFTPKGYKVIAYDEGVRGDRLLAPSYPFGVRVIAYGESESKGLPERSEGN